ncbi:hypothetical protein RHMOL_Rhmol08G0319400 [Rhododendron molle]|uniref:Uncharacterized protein n=1 Tax=Rhododendron molle TaxID=49168 RepID=A0ACC0MV35_RHOML|nr:hypothetical protein RHMOL_Rhmol08G0319400 [Rhododendron molle]
MIGESKGMRKRTGGGSHGKLYVFGGGSKVEPPDVLAELLDTALIDLEEEGMGKADWSPLQECPALGSDRGYFVAACAEGIYSGHILVATKYPGPICLYDVTLEVWKNLGDQIGARAAFNLIVVGTTIYWIDYFDLHLYAYDIVGRREFSMPLGDFDICLHLHSMERPYYPSSIAIVTSVHLAGDVFCLVWVDNAIDSCVHCTELRIRPTLNDAHILCCHAYSFDYSILHCAAQPMDWRG